MPRCRAAWRLAAESKIGSDGTIRPVNLALDLNRQSLLSKSAPIVVPAQAGTYISANRAAAQWIPAFAGMTIGRGELAGLLI